MNLRLVTSALLAMALGVSAEANGQVVQSVDRQTQLAPESQKVAVQPSDFSLSQAAAASSSIEETPTASFGSSSANQMENNAVVTGLKRETQTSGNHAKMGIAGSTEEPVVRGVVRETGDRKSTAPIVINQVTPGQMVGPGKQVVNVTITPLVDGPIEVRATGTEGITVDDQSVWKVEGKSGEPVNKDVVLSTVAPVQGQRRLFLSATVDPQGSAQTGVASFVLNPAGVSAKSSAKTARIATDGKGQTVLEVRAQE